MRKWWMYWGVWEDLVQIKPPSVIEATRRELLSIWHLNNVNTWFRCVFDWEMDDSQEQFQTQDWLTIILKNRSSMKVREFSTRMSLGFWRTCFSWSLYQMSFWLNLSRGGWWYIYICLYIYITYWLLIYFNYTSPKGFNSLSCTAKRNWEESQRIQNIWKSESSQPALISYFR